MLAICAKRHGSFPGYCERVRTEHHLPVHTPQISNCWTLRCQVNPTVVCLSNCLSPLSATAHLRKGPNPSPALPARPSPPCPALRLCFTGAPLERHRAAARHGVALVSSRLRPPGAAGGPDVREPLCLRVGRRGEPRLAWHPCPITWGTTGDRGQGDCEGRPTMKRWIGEERTRWIGRRHVCRVELA